MNPLWIFFSLLLIGGALLLIGFIGFVLKLALLFFNPSRVRSDAPKEEVSDIWEYTHYGESTAELDLQDEEGD